MQIIQSSRESTEISSSYENYKVADVPTIYSRQKALSLISKTNEIGSVNCVARPSRDAVAIIQLLHSKIGASNDLPNSTTERQSYLSELWNTMYLRNNLCPGDVPFNIVMDEFTEAIIHGRAERKGNNMAAIVQCFNAWVVRDETRIKLYQKRDAMYPDAKPKQLGERKSIPLPELTLKELTDRISKARPFASLKSVADLIRTYEDELNRREQ